MLSLFDLHSHVLGEPHHRSAPSQANPASWEESKHVELVCATNRAVVEKTEVRFVIAALSHACGCAAAAAAAAAVAAPEHNAVELVAASFQAYLALILVTCTCLMASSLCQARCYLPTTIPEVWKGVETRHVETWAGSVGLNMEATRANAAAAVAAAAGSQAIGQEAMYESNHLMWAAKCP